MTDTPTRIFGLLCVLVGVWVVTYWVYEPKPPPITFDDRPPALAAVRGARPGRASAVGVGSNSAGDGAREAVRPPAGPEPVRKVKPPAPKVEPKAEAATTVRVVAPKFREIMVQRGDRGWADIAEREYGDRKLGEAISRANPFVTEDKLRPGRTRLQIPVDPGNIQGRLVRETAPGGNGTGGGAKAEPAPAEPQTIDYIIVENDTLSGLAKQFYGKSAMWETIYEANRDVIPDPERMPLGKTIKIPVVPGTASEPGR